jgi:GntR family transcriptional regulator
MSAMRVTRRSPVPLYYQFVEIVKGMLQTEQLLPGKQLPSINELSKQFSISRMTIRQGIAYLAREGVLVVKPGVGTFVASPKLVHDSLDLVGFTEEMNRLGQTPKTQVLEQVLIPASLKINEILGQEIGSPVVKVIRLRLSNDVPLLLETTYSVNSLCPGLDEADLVQNSLFSLYEHEYGLELAYAKQTIEATTANVLEANLLNVQIGAPMLLSEGTVYDRTDRPIEYFKSVYHGAYFKFEVQSRRNSRHADFENRRISVVMD